MTKGRSPIDRVIVVPVKKRIRNEAGQVEDQAVIETFFRQMRDEQFDIVLTFREMESLQIHL
ncbi:MAG: hypothetical protein ACR2KZ_15735 [Segetibacter sp.]